MSKRKPALNLDFGEYGGQIQIKEPNELQTWFQQEVAKWSWLNQVPQTQQVLNSFNAVSQQVPQFVAQWRSLLEQPEQLNAKLQEIKNYLEQQLNGSSTLMYAIKGW